ncbi:MAG: sulfite exporter TauE/SafE family protein [Treponema sp.]|nr:sulfite exporter TauE/SafE family protein [Treponema sp.]MCL2252700.1 sulfite exporter TauE/SafE family protein [Treponema sp.]
MTETRILLGTAISIALIHTLIGVDHYVPFIALSKANNWTIKKTIYIVLLCGLGHVLGSVILGFAGIAFSAGIASLIDIEDMRGTLATYLLIAFGLIYMVYGIRKAYKNKKQFPVNCEQAEVNNDNSHNGHDHHIDDFMQTNKNTKKSKVFWGLFIFFVLGPCEPLIPILMYPAATMNIFTLVLVTVSFSVCTIAVMLLMTILGVKGFRLLKLNKLDKYTHALAGGAVLLCGLFVLVLPI